MMDPTSLERSLGKCTRCVILVLTVLGVLALAGCERWALDRQMEDLSSTYLDGGAGKYLLDNLIASYSAAVNDSNWRTAA